MLLPLRGRQRGGRKGGGGGREGLNTSHTDLDRSQQPIRELLSGLHGGLRPAPHSSSLSLLRWESEEEEAGRLGRASAGAWDDNEQ